MIHRTMSVSPPFTYRVAVCVAMFGFASTELGQLCLSAKEPLLKTPSQIAQATLAAAPTAHDKTFAALAARYIDESPALSPIGATTLGDHRYDHELDDISPAGRERERAFLKQLQVELAKLDRTTLSRDQQVDLRLLDHQLKSDLWRLDTLQEWAWNPIAYTQLPGSAIYGLMAREFAPVEKRLASVTARLEKFPKLFEQIRTTLDPKRVPLVHAETALKQNRGVLSIIENTVRPQMAKLGDAERDRLLKAIEVATQAVEQQQQWLEKVLIPGAQGDARRPDRADRRPAAQGQR